MIFLKLLSAFFVAIHISEAWQDIYSPDGIDMRWTKDTTDEYLEKRYVEPPIFGTFVGKNNHSFALLECENDIKSYPKQCDLMIRIHSFNDQTLTKVCKIHPPSQDDSYTTIEPGVTFLRGDRILVFWKGQHFDSSRNRMKSRIIFADSCKESDLIQINGSFNDQIIRYKNLFYIMFSSITCPKPHYCTLAYNYDGKLMYGYSLLLPVEDFVNLSIDFAYTMNYGNSHEGLVLTGSMKPFDMKLLEKEVYSPIMGWIKADQLFYSLHVYSNSSGFASLCWKPLHIAEQIHCKWLDGNHEDKTLKLAFKNVIMTKMPQMYNTAHGTIILIAPGIDDDESDNVFVDEINIDGRCKRIAKINIPDVNHVTGLEFSMPQNDRFCISYVTYACNSELCNVVRQIIDYRFVTKCSKIDVFNQEYVECGHGYYLNYI